ncbi:MAG TPA: GNAT family N-acetyltransferase [Bradyrhizobium sp.]|nr:GNAT family N-acetyltransferase [Bradyrhizobium sp.]
MKLAGAVRWQVHPVSAFSARAKEWQAINHASGATPLLDPRFVAPLLAAFASGDEVLAVLRGDGRPVAMGIFRRNNAFVWQTLQPANAPLGLFVALPEVVLDAIVPSLMAALSPTCLILGITQQDPELRSRPAAASRVADLDYIETPRISVPASFETYWRGRSKNLRHDVSRQKNRLARQGITAELITLTTRDELARAVADYARIESAGWKGEIGSAVSGEDRQAKFYAEMLGAFAETGEALGCEYAIDGKVVACDLCLLCQETLYILKTTYDESLQGFSPAHLMRHDLFARLFDGRCAVVEFYGPVKDWHRRLTDERRTMYHLNYYRWSFLKFLHRARGSGVA